MPKESLGDQIWTFNRAHDQKVSERWGVVGLIFEGLNDLKHVIIKLME